MESAEKERLFTEKSRAVIGRKKTDERASLMHNLSPVNKFFLSAEGGVRSFDESGFKSR